MTGTQCNFCFVTDDMLLGLFLVAPGEEKIVMCGWVGAAVDEEREKEGNRKEREMSRKPKLQGWEVCWYQSKNV